MNFLNTETSNLNEIEPVTSLFPFLFGQSAHTSNMASLYDQFAALFQQQHPNTVQAQAYGDPHFIGFNNQNFDCMPQIDALLFANNSEQFEIHARHAKVNSNGNSPTVIKAIAIKVKAQIIQYSATDGNLLVDGQPARFEKGDLYAKLEQTQTTIIRDNMNKFDIYTKFGARITIYNCGGYNLNVTLTIPRNVAQNAEPSLFGRLTGDHAQIIPVNGLFTTEQAISHESQLLIDVKHGGEVLNDQKSKEYIESYLEKQGFHRKDHEPTFDNLVFDYLNTPTGIRDQFVAQNTSHVQEQIKVRKEEIQRQEKAGYTGGSLNVVERDEADGYLERLEKRVRMLETRSKMKLGTSTQSMGRLESLEKRISDLEQQYH